MFERRPIAGYEGLYAINCQGAVISEARRVDQGTRTMSVAERCLRPLKGSHGYWTVMLSKNGVRKRVLVHRVLALAWVPNDDPCADEVNHKNGIKTDNNLDNLEWVTTGGNTLHAYKLGLKKANRKLTDVQARSLKKRLAEGASQRQVASEFGISQQQVSAINARKVYRDLA